MTWIKYIQLILIALFGCIIAIEDIKYRNIHTWLIISHLVSVVLYLVVINWQAGLIIGTILIGLFCIILINNINVDIVYIILVCALIILCRLQNVFNPVISSLIGIGLILLVTIINKKDFPFLACLTPVVTILCILCFSKGV